MNRQALTPEVFRSQGFDGLSALFSWLSGQISLAQPLLLIRHMGVWDVISKSVFTLTFCSFLLSGCGADAVQDGSVDPSNDWIVKDLYRNGGTFVGNSPGGLIVNRVGDVITCSFFPDPNTPSEVLPLGIELYVFDPRVGEWALIEQQVGYSLSTHLGGYSVFEDFQCRTYGSLGHSAHQGCKSSDLNRDGFVKMDDLDLMNSYLAVGNLSGDLNEDGFVNYLDSEIVKACINAKVLTTNDTIIYADTAQQGGEL